ncbi:MAG: transketolase [Magnetococcales bacterium]|nr:transketolase [Magnetococcales bacterium]
MTLFAHQHFVFLTGDLGFQALEPLRALMGERFINAGVAEQNMISVAAGLAQQGMMTWVYSIAPFCYARPFEQIRNDVCLHRFPVKLVGNGGGYGYGAMGPSHHAIEDYGALLTLPGMQAWIPMFATDVLPAVLQMAAVNTPAYLRLGRCECPNHYTPPPFAPWRHLLSGGGLPVVVTGPLVGSLLATCLTMDVAVRPDIWGVTLLPVTAPTIPQALLAQIGQQRRLCVVEEHVLHGGVGHMLAHTLLTSGIAVDTFHHAYARGYPSATYGSQQFHRRESGLDTPALLQLMGISP